jgi:hypothetical protein
MDIGKQIDRSGLKVVGIGSALLGGIFLVQLPYMYKSEVDFRSKAIRATQVTFCFCLQLKQRTKLSVL